MQAMLVHWTGSWSAVTLSFLLSSLTTDRPLISLATHSYPSLSSSGREATLVSFHPLQIILSHHLLLHGTVVTALCGMMGWSTCTCMGPSDCTACVCRCGIHRRMEHRESYGFPSQQIMCVIHTILKPLTLLATSLCPTLFSTSAVL